ISMQTGATPTYGVQILGGSARLQALLTPGAPTVTPQGAPGSTSYTYFVVAEDRAGFQTPVSSGGSTATGNATLNGSNFNRITWTAVNGAVKYYILKTDTATLLATWTSGALQVDDTGQATSGFTAPIRNNTADLTVDGQIISNGLWASDQTGAITAIRVALLTG